MSIFNLRLLKILLKAVVYVINSMVGDDDDDDEKEVANG